MHLLNRFGVLVQGALSFSGLWPDSSRFGPFVVDSVGDLRGSGGDIGNTLPKHHVPVLSKGPAIWKSVDELPNDLHYDYIIVGGGTSGSVLASRLAENPQYSILVIEAGSWHEEIQESFTSRVPGLFLNMRNTPVDWKYDTLPQPGLNGRALGYPSGKMMGGSSSLNNMVYTRGSRDNFDRWANITEDDGLSWDNVFPYMLKAERMVDPSAKLPTNGHADPVVHGHQGTLSTSAPYTDHVFNQMLLRSTEELKDEFPFKLDMNDGKPIGIGWSQFTIDHHGARSSSATSYLRNVGPNVHVLVNTQVTRVLRTDSSTSDFKTVEFAQSAQSERKTVAAKKEVILSAGVIGTPRILLNSGIGSRKELTELGIETILDNPSVGKNLTDHPLMQIAFETTIPDTDYNMNEALAEWNQTGKGPMAMPHHLNHICWVRLGEDATPFSKDGLADPIGDMPNAPHIELIPLQISSHPPPVTIALPPVPDGVVALLLGVSNLNPVSRGSISLKNSDPFTYPIIDFNLFDKEIDISIMREGIRAARRLYSAPVFKDSVMGTILPGKDVTSDEGLDDYIRKMTGTFTHGAGSAAMSPRGASWGVVDPDFRVKGTTGLRVVDASVLPSLPSAHTQAAVYGVAEWGSAVVGRQ